MASDHEPSGTTRPKLPGQSPLPFRSDISRHRACAVSLIQVCAFGFLMFVEAEVPSSHSSTQQRFLAAEFPRSASPARGPLQARVGPRSEGWRTRALPNARREGLSEFTLRDEIEDPLQGVEEAGATDAELTAEDFDRILKEADELLAGSDAENLFEDTYEPQSEDNQQPMIDPQLDPSAPAEWAQDSQFADNFVPQDSGDRQGGRNDLFEYLDAPSQGSAQPSQQPADAYQQFDNSQPADAYQQFDNSQPADAYQQFDNSQPEPQGDISGPQPLQQQPEQGQASYAAASDQVPKWQLPGGFAPPPRADSYQSQGSFGAEPETQEGRPQQPQTEQQVESQYQPPLSAQPLPQSVQSQQQFQQAAQPVQPAQSSWASSQQQPQQQVPQQQQSQAPPPPQQQQQLQQQQQQVLPAADAVPGGSCLEEDRAQQCSGRGLCLVTGQCHCEQGFAGGRCQLTCPGHIPGSSPVVACNGNGLCIEDGSCVCQQGFSGQACEVVPYLEHAPDLQPAPEQPQPPLQQPPAVPQQQQQQPQQQQQQQQQPPPQQQQPMIQQQQQQGFQEPQPIQSQHPPTSANPMPSNPPFQPAPTQNFAPAPAPAQQPASQPLNGIPVPQQPEQQPPPEQYQQQYQQQQPQQQQYQQQQQQYQQQQQQPASLPPAQQQQPSQPPPPPPQAPASPQRGACGTDSMCSNHGRCSSRAGPDGGEGCLCEGGWAGSYCETACPGLTQDGMYCSGAGSCSREGECRCDEGRWGPACENTCPGGDMNACSGHGICGVRGTCSCEQGWTGLDCSRIVGALGAAMQSRVVGPWTGSEVELPEGWVASDTVATYGMPGREAGSASEALQKMLAGSAPFPSQTPVSAQLRFDQQSAGVQMRAGQRVSSGMFYLWHPADEGQDPHGLGDGPAFMDLMLTQGAMLGHVRALVYSNSGGKLVIAMGYPGSPRPEALPGSFSEPVMLAVLAHSGADAASAWPWPVAAIQAPSVAPAAPAPQQASQPVIEQQPTYPSSGQQSQPVAVGGGIGEPVTQDQAGDDWVGGPSSPSAWDESVPAQGAVSQDSQSTGSEGGEGLGGIAGGAEEDFAHFVPEEQADRGGQGGAGGGEGGGAAGAAEAEMEAELREVLETCWCCVEEAAESEKCCLRVDDDAEAARSVCKQVLADHTDGLHQIGGGGAEEAEARGGGSAGDGFDEEAEEPWGDDYGQDGYGLGGALGPPPNEDLYSVLHLPRLAVLGLMLLACAAVLVGVKRYRCWNTRGKGGRRYGHYRMVGLSGSAPPSDTL